MTTTPVREQKEYGYTTTALHAYEEARRELDLPAFWQPVDQGNSNVAAEVAALLAAHPDLTAVVAPQDSSLPGIWRAIHAAGLRIPDDISVVGLIDESVSDFIMPPLTAIDFPSRVMGEAAVNILIRQLNDPAVEPEQQLLPATLILRQTTAPSP